VIVAHAPWFPRTFAACAALGLAVPTMAAAQHTGHPPPAPAHDHAGHAAPARDTVRAAPPAPANIRAEFVAGPPGSSGSRRMIEGRVAELRVRLTDRVTGRPVTGLEPMGWVDVRHDSARTSMSTCQQGVGAFVEATLHIKHGQVNMTQPVEDLNGHYVVALARGGAVVVIDPVKGFGRTRMLTAIPLGAEGGGWAATPDDRRVFITLPTRGEVVVIDTYGWKIEARIAVGGEPAGARMAPDGSRLWVLGAEGGVAVIDARTLAVVGRVAVGAGPHALAFSGDGRAAFVTAREAGSVAVIDAATLARTAAARTGAAPTDVAWSAARGAAFVVDEAEGAVSVVDTRGTVAERIPFAPGLRGIRFAPDPSHAHGAHGGGHAAAGDGGKLAFLLNPLRGTLEIYDVMARRTIRTLSGAPHPDQVAFTGSFAYVRAAGTPSVALIPLANPTSGAVGPHDYFQSGSVPPGPVQEDSLGDVLIPQPGMHDAVYAANPRERMVYSYHYMEGMPVPHGGLTTYGFTPRAVRVVSRRIRETEPGVYAATLRMERAGDYDLIFRSPEPYLLGCYPFTVSPDDTRRVGLRVAVAEPAMKLRAGGQPVRFRVSEAEGGTAVAGLADLGVLLVSSDGWQQRMRATPVGAGLYEATFDLPAAGTYYASFEIPSRGVTMRDLSPAMIQVQP
jgi:YVTN family beta-propeller protein